MTSGDGGTWRDAYVRKRRRAGVTPHWHALQDAGAKSTVPACASRLGLRQSLGAFPLPIRIPLKFNRHGYLVRLYLRDDERMVLYDLINS
jgi:hypothetical protein